jgi:nitrite reductase (NADH) small subunit
MSQPVVGRDVWTAVCRCEDLEIGRGATALVNGQAVALFRMDEEEVYVLGNHDPFARPREGGGDSGAGMLARGIVGRRGDVPIVGSPLHRHAFDLRTGRCLEDPSVHVPTYQVRIRDGIVHVGPRAS